MILGRLELAVTELVLPSFTHITHTVYIRRKLLMGTKLKGHEGGGGTSSIHAYIHVYMTSIIKCTPTRRKKE